jgi:2-dehydropantoate 2-reductase
LTELKNLAEANNITLSENIIQKTLDKMASFPYESTSSMHRDFQKGNKTELDTLTDYVVTMGRELNIPTPYYEKMLIGLKEKLAK